MSKIYLASPYGFAESTVDFLVKLKSDLRREGHEVIEPWERGEKLLATFQATAGSLSSEERIAELAKKNHILGESNRGGIDESDVLVAALDGPDVDSGTASEIGYAYACGKKIFGYRGDTHLTGENEAASVNLQIQYWIVESGGQIVRTIPDLLAGLKVSMQAREEERQGRSPDSTRLDSGGRGV